jgi:hypothetical protein
MEDVEWADSTWNEFMSQNCVSFSSDLIVNDQKLTGAKPKWAMVWHIWTVRTCQHNIMLSLFTSIMKIWNGLTAHEMDSCLQTV